jgi:hypothetical protein
MSLEAYTPTLSIPGRALPEEDFCDRLQKTSVTILESRSPLESELEVECQAWDALSDEALDLFERELD